MTERQAPRGILEAFLLFLDKLQTHVLSRLLCRRSCQLCHPEIKTLLVGLWMLDSICDPDGCLSEGFLAERRSTRRVRFWFGQNYIIAVCSKNNMGQSCSEPAGAVDCDYGRDNKGNCLPAMWVHIDTETKSSICGSASVTSGGCTIDHVDPGPPS